MIEELIAEQSDSASADLLAALAILCLASAAIGAVLQYWRDALHYDHHRPHPHRVHDWWAREIQAWRNHRARTHRRPQ
ncbi:hypothetical protein [Mycobacterium malmoense]|uniref:hypothetical protein n=1 Tax=Mycobacterium malmoense TaxID=1780 RepID=UPI0008F95866|nr:hypothetical protein [Mycobacterium malmoense]OIN79357.1 hypothetical protein BMG05_18400 [Mycobacterium malmoense]